MPYYKFRQVKREEKGAFDILQLMIDMFNLGGFRFSPCKARPEIQEFMDKYPDMVELIEEE